MTGPKRRRMSPVRRRVIGTLVVASVFSAVWIWAGSLPGAGLTAMYVFVGLAAPFGVAALFLGLTHRDLQRLEWRRRRYVSSEHATERERQLAR
jgi:Mn2+/Fe2+ NRAMP family transporter